MMKKINPGPYNISQEKYTLSHQLSLVSWEYGVQHAYPCWIGFIHRSFWDQKSEFLHTNPSKVAFEIPLEGNMVIEIDGLPNQVNVGEILILPAGVQNTLRTGPAGFCRKCSFGISGNMVQSLLASLGLEGNRVYSLKNPDRILGLLDSAVRIMHEADPVQAPRLAGLTMEILAELSEQCTERNLRREVADAVRIIEYNLIHNMSVSEIASTLGISRQQLYLLFRKQFGTSPKRYIMDLRMRQAETMLRQSRMQIKTIAANVGCSSELHLIREFRKRFGVTPGTYRKNLRKSASVSPSGAR